MFETHKANAIAFDHLFFDFRGGKLVIGRRDRRDLPHLTILWQTLPHNTFQVRMAKLVEQEFSDAGPKLLPIAQRIQEALQLHEIEIDLPAMLPGMET